MLVEMNTDLASAVVLPSEVKEMISVRTEGDTTIVKINSSSLGLLQECGRKSFYTLEQKWHSQTESAATRFGRAVHKGLEVFYKGLPEERVLPRLEQLELLAYGHPYPATNNDLIYRAVEAFVKEAQPLSTLPESDKRSLQNGIWILYEYFKQFINDPYVALVDNLGPFIERSFVLPFHREKGLEIEIFGTIDFAFRHTQTGEVILGDHKTSSSLSFGDSSYFDRDKPNHQYTMYMLGGREVFGINTESFLVNVIEVKAKPKTAKGKGVSFPRQITRRTDEDFAELKEVIVSEVKNYLEMRRTGVWPLGPVGSCNSYGSCQFKQVCASPKSLRETILQSKFNREGI